MMPGLDERASRGIRWLISVEGEVSGQVRAGVAGAGLDPTPPVNPPPCWFVAPVRDCQQPDHPRKVGFITPR